MLSSSLTKHILGTYSRLRRGMAVIAFLFPLVLLIGGLAFFGVAPQPSMSAYYHTDPNLRDTFVGVLFAVGTFLFLYKGDTPAEDWLLNVAGASAIGIAYFEMVKGSDCSTASQGVTAHGFFAVVFFLAISLVCVSVALRSQAEHGGRYLSRHASYYGVCAAIMLVSMGVGLVYSFLLPQATRQALCNNNIIFWVEAFGVWGFSVSWFLRTIELDHRVSWLPWRSEDET